MSNTKVSDINKTAQDEYSRVVKELDSNIPAEAVSKRRGNAGTTLSYLEGHYVIDRMNKVIGQGNWAYEIVDQKIVYEGVLKDHYNNDKFHVSYLATVKLSVEFGAGPVSKRVYFTDVGYGNGVDKTNPGAAHELAAKESVTDALKRCIKNLGQSMGLALYDKEQKNVSDTEEVLPKAKASTKKPKKTPPKSDPKKLRETLTKRFKILRTKQALTDEARETYLKESFGVTKVAELKETDIPKVLDYIDNNYKNMLGA